MTDLQNTLKQHEIGWIGDGLSLKRDVPFFYKDMRSPNPDFRIDVITASPQHRNWYFRIYEGKQLLRKDSYFTTAEEALVAGLLISTREQAGELSLRRIERWEGDHAYVVDGHTDTDTVIAEVEQGRWWIFMNEESRHRQCSGPWTTLEEALGVYRYQMLKVN